MWSSTLAAAAAATLLLASLPTTDASPSLDCSSRPDGFFSLGCSSSFVACSGGRAITKDCPAHLIYDEKRQKCEYPGNVEACAGETPEEGSGIEDGSGDGSIEGSGGEENEEGSSEIEEISGMCEERPDGFYKLDQCGEQFIGCSGGVAWRMACPASLKYDEKAQICDYPGNVANCANSDDGSGEGSNEGSGYGTASHDVTIEDEEETEEMIAETDDKEEDAEVKEIETEDEIIEDSGVVVEKEEDVETAGTPSENSPVAQYDDVDDTPSCDGRRDGFYARGCSSEMFACSSGVLSTMACPGGLVFDERNQICDHPAHVSACSSRDQLLTEDALLTTDNDQGAPHPEIPRARDSETTDATLAPTTPAGPTEAATAVEWIEAPTKSRRDPGCKSSDGFFSLDCSIDFFSCRAGVATKLECGEGEAFDEPTQSCVQLARHPTCYTHAIQPTDVIDDDVQMEKEKDDMEDLEKPIDHSFSCDFSGARAESACSDWFRLCENGRGIEMFCLQGYLFDGDAAKCVPAGQLAECKAQ